MVAKRVIMGGSGSTGSSLLKNILNRHTQIYGTIETSLFSKKDLYDNWNEYKSRIVKRGLGGLKSFAWHRYNGVDLPKEYFGLSQKEISDLIDSSNSFQEFSDRFFLNSMNENELIWLEKTPFNCFSFRMFNKLMEDSYVIHMVRNPYDTIASLYGRGYSLSYAVGIYLLNTAAGLSARGDRYLEVKYEDLILYPQETVTRLCRFLGVDYEESMLQAQYEDIGDSKLSSWNYDETHPLKKGSVGRFNKLPIEEQEIIKAAVQDLVINQKGVEYFDLGAPNIKELCNLLDYEYKSTSKNISLRLKKELAIERVERLVKLYETGMKFPLSIK